MLHTLFDFDMSFMLIQLVVYVCMAILLKDQQEIKNLKIKKHNVFDYGIIIFLFFVLSIYIRADISKYLLTDNAQRHQLTPYKSKYYNEMINDDIKNNKDNIDILNELQDYMEKELYSNQNENYERYFKLIYQNIYDLDNEELKKYLSFGIERVKNVRAKSPMYFEFVIKRNEILANSIKNFETYIADVNSKENQENKQKIEILNNAVEELKNIINCEYETNISNLEDFERNGYEDIVRKNFKKKYQEIVDSIN